MWHDRALAMVYASALGAWLFLIINSVLKLIVSPNVYMISGIFSLLLSILLAIVIYKKLELGGWEEYVDGLSERNKKRDTPSESEIEAAVQNKVGEVTTRIRAATPQEMISCVETVLKKVKKEYITPYKNKDPEGYGDAEKKEAYRLCMAQVKVLMKYHNFKVNQEIIDLYILTMDTEDEIMKTLE